jgi:hypothetical protein
MERHDLVRASLIVSLACMAPLGEYAVGAEPLQANSSLSREAESSRIVNGSKVTLQNVASVPGSTGIDTSASLFRARTRSSQRWSKKWWE